MYSYIYNNFSKNEIMFMTIPILFIANLPLIFFTILDIYQFSYFSKLRICYNSFRKYPTQIEIRDGIIESSKGFFGIIIPISFIGIAFANYRGIYLYDMSNNLPNIYIALLQIFLILFMSDILFYSLHRLMHTKYLYSKFHKFHHTYKEPFALTNHYVDPFELILFFIPPMVPPILLNTHITVMWLCTIIMNWNGIIIHSGYNFTFFKLTYKINKKIFTFEFPCIKEHDHHHKYFNYNFGATFPFMDQLMGTYYID